MIVRKLGIEAQLIKFSELDGPVFVKKNGKGLTLSHKAELVILENVVSL